MKKIFTFATLMIVLSAVISHANATIRRVAPAGYFNSPVANTDFTDLQSAHDAAAPGDTIQVYPGANWQAYYSKPLVTMGWGYYVDEATYGTGANKNLQNITGYVNTGVYLSAGSDNSVFEGLDAFHVHGDGSGATITGIIVRRCLGQVDLSAHNVFTNWQISQCYLSHLSLNTDAASQAVINNLTVSNSRLFYVGAAEGTSGNTNNGQFINCVFETDAYFNNGSYLLKNNIFLATIAQDANCVYQYNLYINDSRTIPGVGNRGISSADMTTKVFKGYSTPGNNSNDARFVLKTGSPAKDINDTTDAGIYGGPTPYKLSGIPAVPAFYKFAATNPSVSANPLTVSFSVRSNNDAQAAISRVEYYIDDDPGYGNGTAVAVPNATNIANKTLSINIAGKDSGDHFIYIRSLDAAGGWSLDNRDTFTITTRVSPPAITLNSVSKNKLCVGETFSVAIDAKGNSNASNRFNVELSNPNGSFPPPSSPQTVIGYVDGTKSAVISCVLPATLDSTKGYKIRVRSTNPVRASNIMALDVSTYPAAPTITPNGPTTFCPGGSVGLTSTAAPTGGSYLWSNGATTQTNTVRNSGDYTVTVANANGCQATSAATQVTVLACTSPNNRTRSGITATAVNLSWGSVNCGASYQVQYREKHTPALSWSSPITANTNSLTLTGLTPNTTYEWHVKTVCSASSSSGYANGSNFTTAASLTANASGKLSMKEKSGLNASIYPNPVSTTTAVLNISRTFKPVTVTLSDVTGKVLWKSANVSASRTDLPVVNLSTGIYLVSVTDGVDTKILKLVKGQ